VSETTRREVLEGMVAFIAASAATRFFVAVGEPSHWLEQGAVVYLPLRRGTPRMLDNLGVTVPATAYDALDTTEIKYR